MTPQRAEWHKQVSEFGRPSPGKATWQLINSVGPYLCLWALMVFTVLRGYSYWITLALSLPAAGFMIRTFIIFHDCCHGSFVKSRTLTKIIGYVSGVLTFTPFEDWKICHLKHHATSGDLDRRGEGDVWMMTVKEYQEASPGLKLAYRLFRNPLVLFGLGPALVFILRQRLPEKAAGERGRPSVWITDLALAGILVVAAFTIGLWNYVKIQLPIMVFAGAFGLWLFYVQHQYDGVHWVRHDDWDFTEAGLKGSSYYKLPKILQWFSGNIGLHHIHHVRPGIPNYNLQPCLDSVPAMREVRPLTLRQSLRSLWMNLWDEERGKMVSFRSLRRAGRERVA